MFLDQQRARLIAPENEAAQKNRGGITAGNTQRQQGDQRAAGIGVVGALGRGHAFDHAGAEFLRMAGYRLFETVGQKRRHRRAGAGKGADNEADHRAIQKSKAAILEILQRRQKIS